MTDADFVSITRNGQLCDKEGELGPHEFDQVMRELVRAHTLQSLSIDTAFMLPHEEVFSRRGSAKMILMELQRLGEALDRLQPGICKPTAATMPCKGSVELKSATLDMPKNSQVESKPVVTRAEVDVNKIHHDEIVMTGQEAAAIKSVAENVDFEAFKGDNSQNTPSVEMARVTDRRSSVKRPPSDLVEHASMSAAALTNPSPNRQSQSRSAANSSSRQSLHSPGTASYSDAHLNNGAGCTGISSSGRGGVCGSGSGSNRNQTLKKTMGRSHHNLGSVISESNTTNRPQTRQPMRRALSDVPAAAAWHASSHSARDVWRDGLPGESQSSAKGNSGEQHHGGAGAFNQVDITDSMVLRAGLLHRGRRGSADLVQVSRAATLSAGASRQVVPFTDCSLRPRPPLSSRPPQSRVSNTSPSTRQEAYWLDQRLEEVTTIPQTSFVAIKRAATPR